MGNQTLEEFRKNLSRFRFAVLWHQFSPDTATKDHWDLLLEPPQPDYEKLLCFEVLEPPETWPKTLQIRRLADHRRLYLDYEGDIAGNRGRVTRVLDGEVEWLDFKEDALRMVLFPVASSSRTSTPVRLGLRKIAEADQAESRCLETWSMVIDEPLVPPRPESGERGRG